MSTPRALVTGARGMLGRSLIRALDGAGYDVIAHSRSTVTEATGTWRSGDLTDPAVARELATDLGPIDLLVNNAADQSTGRLRDLSPEDWSAMIGATLMSAVHLSVACAPAMPPGSAIVNVSSIEASSPFPGHAHYAAAKAALESFTRSAAREWAPVGIRVNAVAPGLIARPGLEQEWPDGFAWWTQSCPLGRAIEPDEVAEAVLFLARAAAISGIVMAVDGGWSGSTWRP